MSEENRAGGYRRDEMSLKEIILKISGWLSYLLSKWKILVLAAVIGVVAGFAYSFTREAIYTAEITFVLEGDGASSGSMGVYAGIARQFGIDLGGGGTSTVFSEGNFFALLESHLLITGTLLEPLDSSVNKQSLADYYITTHNMWEEWGIENGDTVSFPPATPRDSLSLRQNSLLKKLHQKIITEHLKVGKSEKTSFIIATCVSNDELFSKLFVERLMNKVSEFYIQTKTKRTRESIEKLEIKADSIEKVLNEQTLEVASQQDLNQNQARRVANVGIEVASREKQILQSVYSEVMQNLEISKISLLRETPLIQIVDTPILPLRKELPSPVNWMLLGGFLAFFLTAFVLLIKHIYKEIMYS